MNTPATYRVVIEVVVTTQIYYTYSFAKRKYLWYILYFLRYGLHFNPHSALRNLKLSGKLSTSVQNSLGCERFEVLFTPFWRL
ncbi:MAG TPA: hypothetical protein DEB74_16780 [Lachnospiraceae bacterium]|nr:hypothetical protein [Lachnospiraceae bacterium]